MAKKKRNIQYGISTPEREQGGILFCLALLSFPLVLFVLSLFKPVEGIDETKLRSIDAIVVYIDQNMGSIFLILLIISLMFFYSIYQYGDEYLSEKTKHFSYFYVSINAVLIILLMVLAQIVKQDYVCWVGRDEFWYKMAGSFHSKYDDWCVGTPNLIEFIFTIILSFIFRIFAFFWFVYVSGIALAIAFIMMLIPRFALFLVERTHYAFAMWPLEKDVRRAQRDEARMDTSLASSTFKRPKEEKPPPSFVSRNRAKKAEEMAEALRKERELMEEIEKRERELEALRRRKWGSRAK